MTDTENLQLSESQFFITVLATKGIKEFFNPCLASIHTATFVNHANDLYTHLTRSPCNLLIIEINSEDFDGYDVKQQAKTLAPTARLVFISKTKTMDSVVNSNIHGADYLFFLPFEKEAVKKALITLHKRRLYWFDMLKDIKESE